MNISKLFSIPESYKKQLKNYSLKDFILVFLVYSLLLLTMFFSGILIKKAPEINSTFLGITINFSFVILILIVLKIKKEKICSIGLREGNLRLSLILGIIFSVILFFCNCLLNIIFEHQHFISASKIVENFFYYFSVGLCEEILFRGFILTRIHSITKNIFFDIFITGILFVLFHFPFRMVAYSLSFTNFITNYSNILDLFITNCILAFIRIRSDNIYGSILPHWISDLSYSIVTHI